MLFSFIAFLIYKKGESKGLTWPHYFAFGVALLALAHLIKSLYPDLSVPLDAPPKFAGLIAILYAMLKEVDHPKTDLLTGLGVLNGIAYDEAALFYFIFKVVDILTLLVITVPQYLFLTIGPLVGAYILLKVYSASKDRFALLFGMGFVVYAVANFFYVTGLYWHAAPLELYYIVMIITSAIGVAIGVSI